MSFMYTEANLGSGNILTASEPTDGTASYGTNVELHRISFARQVHDTGELLNPMVLLEGTDNPLIKGAAPAIIRMNDLTTNGKTIRYTYEHPSRDNPYLMDRDLHTLENKLNYSHQDIVINAQRKVLITSEWEKQLPAFELQPRMSMASSVWHSYYKGKLALYSLLGVNLLDPTDKALHTGVYCTNQVVAGDNSNVSQLGSDDIFTGDLISRAKAIGNAGFRRQGDETHFFDQVIVQGRAYDGVCLCHEYQAYDMRWSDPDFKAALLNAVERGRNTNRIFTGLKAMFEYDGVLYMILKGELGAELLFNTSGYISGAYNTTGTSGKICDEDNTGYAPAVNGATAIYMGGRAMARAVGSVDFSARLEGYDGNWFTRTHNAAIEGVANLVAPNYRKDSTGATDRNIGLVLIHTAATNPNLVAGP